MCVFVCITFSLFSQQQGNNFRNDLIGLSQHCFYGAIQFVRVCNCVHMSMSMILFSHSGPLCLQRVKEYLGTDVGVFLSLEKTTTINYCSLNVDVSFYNGQNGHLNQ